MPASIGAITNSTISVTDEPVDDSSDELSSASRRLLLAAHRSDRRYPTGCRHWSDHHHRSDHPPPGFPAITRLTVGRQCANCKLSARCGHPVILRGRIGCQRLLPIKVSILSHSSIGYSELQSHQCLIGERSLNVSGALRQGQHVAQVMVIKIDTTTRILSSVIRQADSVQQSATSSIVSQRPLLVASLDHCLPSRLYQY